MGCVGEATRLLEPIALWCCGMIGSSFDLLNLVPVSRKCLSSTATSTKRQQSGQEKKRNRTWQQSYQVYKEKGDNKPSEPT